ncbi:MAG TPA: hypothetical protein VGH28_02360 [Polyangiaceae bacterium]
MPAFEGPPWVCMDCAARNDAAGNCARCGEGPLVDARDALVRKTLRDQDDERGRKRSRTLIVAAAAIGSIFGLPCLLLFGEVLGLVVVVLLAAGIYGVLRLTFSLKPRFGDVQP